MKNNLHCQARDYNRIAHAIHYLEDHVEDQPELDDLAAHVGLSTSHLQRVFSRWAGISPKRFLQFLTLRHSRQILRESGQNLLDTTHSSGLSSVSRLHDLYLRCEAMTPAEYRASGRGITIDYGVHPTPFGQCVIGLTDRGLCGFLFVKDNAEQTLHALQRNWKNAKFRNDDQRTKAVCREIFSASGTPGQPLCALIKGTSFQIKVWEALLNIPMGEIVSYQFVAENIDQPKSTRAVANAIASNPLHYLIPCHRVIQSNGMPGGYRAGPLRKKILLGWEAAQMESEGTAS